MSVSVSQIVWTVICFCVFMLVITKLLFQPVLRLMDARRKKIEDSRAHLSLLEQQYAEQLQEEEKARAAQEERRKEELKQERAALAEQGGAVRQALLQKTAEEFTTYEKECMDIIGGTDEALETSLDRLADVYIEKLVSDF